MSQIITKRDLFNYNYVLLLTNDHDKISNMNSFRVSAKVQFLIWGPLM